jgi:predicted N-acyltransferase
MTLYTYTCIHSLAEICDKYETLLRIIYTPTESILSRHFLFHDLTQKDTANEYGFLGRLNKIYYFKNEDRWQIFFDNINYNDVLDPTEKIFIYENVKR